MHLITRVLINLHELHILIKSIFNKKNHKSLNFRTAWFISIYTNWFNSIQCFLLEQMPLYLYSSMEIQKLHVTQLLIELIFALIAGWYLVVFVRAFAN